MDLVAPDQGARAGSSGRRLKALDVGCGPGLVMQELGPLFNVQGLDRDKGMVEACRAKGLTVFQGEAEEMPFDDDCFDVVYCSFLLLWVKEPKLVVKEMRRVSRQWVVCLAEPDMGGRIDHPSSLIGLKDLLIEGMLTSRGGPIGGKEADRAVPIGRFGPRGRGSPWRMEGRLP